MVPRGGNAPSHSTGAQDALALYMDVKAQSPAAPWIIPAAASQKLTAEVCTSQPTRSRPVQVQTYYTPFCSSDQLVPTAQVSPGLGHLVWLELAAKPADPLFEGLWVLLAT